MSEPNLRGGSTLHGCHSWRVVLTAGVTTAPLLKARVAAADTAPADPTPLPLPVPDSSQATPETDPTRSVNESLEKRAKNYREEHFIDPEDGAFDISQFLAPCSGFLAGPTILTERPRLYMPGEPDCDTSSHAASSSPAASTAHGVRTAASSMSSSAARGISPDRGSEQAQRASEPRR